MLNAISPVRKPNASVFIIMIANSSEQYYLQENIRFVWRTEAKKFYIDIYKVYVHYACPAVWYYVKETDLVMLLVLDCWNIPLILEYTYIGKSEVFSFAFQLEPSGTNWVKTSRKSHSARKYSL